jgi:uncharacterized protein YeeX (DUF496 family)
MRGIGLGPGGFGTVFRFVNQRKERKNVIARASKEEEPMIREERKRMMGDNQLEEFVALLTRLRLDGVIWPLGVVNDLP